MLSVLSHAISCYLVYPAGQYPSPFLRCSLVQRSPVLLSFGVRSFSDRTPRSPALARSSVRPFCLSLRRLLVLVFTRYPVSASARSSVSLGRTRLIALGFRAAAARRYREYLAGQRVHREIDEAGAVRSADTEGRRKEFERWKERQAGETTKEQPGQPEEPKRLLAMPCRSRRL